MSDSHLEALRMKNLKIVVAALALLFPAVPPTLGDDQFYKTMEIGQPAPDFSLPGTDGRTYSLKDFADAKILAIVFTANHCPTAQAYEDRIIQLVKDYKDKGVTIVAISPNDPKALRLNELGYTDLGDTLEEMKIRAKDKGFNFPYLYDGEEQKTAHAYGPVSTPHVFIFDNDRRLSYTGRIDNNERIGKATVHDTRNAIEALLAGKSVPVEKTKTFGCSIKWSEKRESVREDFQNLAREPVSLETIDSEGIHRIVRNESKKLRLVNIWATWCGPCVNEFSDLVTINRMYRHRDVEVITISSDALELKDKVLTFLKEKQASFNNYQFNVDDNYQLIDAVDKDWQGAIPYTLLVAPEGKILHRQMGEIDALKLRKAIVGYIGRYYK
jgi:peroxiredoxin